MVENTQTIDQLMNNLECIPGILVIIIILLVILIFFLMRVTEQKPKRKEGGITWLLMEQLEELRETNEALRKENSRLKQTLDILTRSCPKMKEDGEIGLL